LLGSGVIAGGIIMSAKKLGALLLIGILLAAAVLVVADPLGLRSPGAVSRPERSTPAQELIQANPERATKVPETPVESASVESPADAGEPTKVVSGIVIDARTAIPIEGAILSGGRHDDGER